MPFLRVLTNAELRTSADSLAEKAAGLIADELNKPISYVVVTIKQNRTMSFGGKVSNTGVLAYMDSIGFGNHKATLAQKLTDFFMTETSGIDLNNIDIVFNDLPAEDVSIGGSLLG